MYLNRVGGRIRKRPLIQPTNRPSTVCRRRRTHVRDGDRQIPGRMPRGVPGTIGLSHRGQNAAVSNIKRDSSRRGQTRTPPSVEVACFIVQTQTTLHSDCCLHPVHSSNRVLLRTARVADVVTSGKWLILWRTRCLHGHRMFGVAVTAIPSAHPGPSRGKFPIAVAVIIIPSSRH